MTLLSWPIFWFVCLVFVVVEALLIGSAVRMGRNREPGGADSTIPAAGRFNLFWTVLPALLMAVLLLLISQSMAGSGEVLP
jgi:heme/copper-type cytochrome/quinol oxidase subunit 2